MAGAGRRNREACHSRIGNTLRVTYVFMNEAYGKNYDAVGLKTKSSRGRLYNLSGNPSQPFNPVYSTRPVKQKEHSLSLYANERLHA